MLVFLVAETKWGAAGWLPFRRRKLWDSFVVSKDKSHQLENSTLIFFYLQCQYCRWAWTSSGTTSASASLQPPSQVCVQGPWSPTEDRFGCSIQTAVCKGCLRKVVWTVCAPHPWSFCVFIFLTTSDFLGQELLRYITIYHVTYTSLWKRVFSHANKTFTESLLWHTAAAPCYCSSSTCVAPPPSLIRFCS